MAPSTSESPLSQAVFWYRHGLMSKLALLSFATATSLFILQLPLAMLLAQITVALMGGPIFAMVSFASVIAITFFVSSKLVHHPKFVNYISQRFPRLGSLLDHALRHPDYLLLPTALIATPFMALFLTPFAGTFMLPVIALTGLLIGFSADFLLAQRSEFYGKHVTARNATAFAIMQLAAPAMALALVGMAGGLIPGTVIGLALAGLGYVALSMVPTFELKHLDIKHFTFNTEALASIKSTMNVSKLYSKGASLFSSSTADETAATTEALLPQDAITSASGFNLLQYLPFVGAKKEAPFKAQYTIGDMEEMDELDIGTADDTQVLSSK